MKRYYLGTFAVCAMFTHSAEAGPREDVMSAASQCFALIDDKAWLDCYFAAARPMQATVAAAPPAAVAMIPPVRAAAPAPRQAPRKRSGWLSGIFGDDRERPQDFGAAQPANAPMLTDHITARLTKYSFSPQGLFTITLDNGQVWQQAPGDTLKAPLKAAAGSYTVTIRHGLVLGYTLFFKSVPGLYHVKRL